MSMLEPLKRVTTKYHPLIAMMQVDCNSTQVEKISFAITTTKVFLYAKWFHWILSECTRLMNGA